MENKCMWCGYQYPGKITGLRERKHLTICRVYQTTPTFKIIGGKEYLQDPDPKYPNILIERVSPKRLRKHPKR